MLLAINWQWTADLPGSMLTLELHSRLVSSWYDASDSPISVRQQMISPDHVLSLELKLTVSHFHG